MCFLSSVVDLCLGDIEEEFLSLKENRRSVGVRGEAGVCWRRVHVCVCVCEGQEQVDVLKTPTVIFNSDSRPEAIFTLSKTIAKEQPNQSSI